MKEIIIKFSKLNFYVNGDDVRHLKGLETEIKPNSSIDIVPAMAGG